MRRVILAVTGTIAGLVALLSFKTHPAMTTTGTLPSAGLPAAGTTAPATSAPAPNSTAPSTATGGSSSAAPSSSAASPGKDYTGQAIDTRYGTVQVRVTMTGNTISNVAFVQLTSYDPRSQEINAQAGPILLQETLSAQSANIDGVSGATYTSNGYAQSLQSALDQVGH